MTSVEVRPETGPVPPAPNGASQRYRAVWRWHFYAGLFVAPILVVLAVTGSIYLFKEPFEEWRYRDVRTLAAPVTAAQPLSRQIDAARSARPGAPVMTVIPPTAPDRSTRVILAGAESGPWAQGISVYVHPGTLKVLGQIDDSATFMRVVRTVHGELLAGTAGDRIVETAACWALILASTGTYLWWRGPARRRGARPGRPRLRRVHSLTGIGAGTVIVFLIVSGLPWSGVWGDLFQRLQDRTGSTTPSADAFPNTSAVPPLSGDLSTDPDAKVPWSAERLPVPSSTDGHGAHGTTTGVLHPGAVPVERALESARPVLRDCRPTDCDVKVLLPKDRGGVYTVIASPRTDPSASRTVHVDQYSARVLVSFGWQEYGVLAKAVEQGIALHEGRRYGPLNLLVMLTACLAVLTLVVTGTWMWWKRRPQGRLAAPTRPTDRRTAYGVLAIMATLGLLFPLAGITMATVLLLDLLLLRRIPRLRRAFG
ncbi:PepSY-associated TM helix domain-containing protein [Sphaerisporangium aureirubrum]|uniref:PepSY-associated TM helix domain-containing protein n=1 Tax=Sphaerisporangium aureirubrum TaxID=1544736 RepID=A0ABW1NA38_9ACTN